MALKTVHVSDVPHLDQVPENATIPLYSDRFSKVNEGLATTFKSSKFLVIGHRGNGMNMLHSSDRRMKAIKENSILSFNTAGKFSVDFVEFDVQVVFEYAKDRPIIFSTFQPDAAQLIRKLQSTYPVFFLTNGGHEIYSDVRRNSLDEAIKLCLASGLQGIVSEVKAVFRNPGAIAKIKESNLSLLTYGQLNNVREAVYMQHVMGIDGVIVDLVQEITVAVAGFIKPEAEGEEETSTEGDEQIQGMMTRPKFSQRELSFLLKLIPELIQP
uniref:glycerophosphodiester phosphodiesterase n=1 Tax=Nelumbo nucifera TaxID=4432 RepID=A0A822YNH8_NELNU|nr:TPA_asm: hypothetical protein HUJ06_004790 [Nelumbo nucifera]